ncbi:Rho guanine nucleotide exchange factor, putative [Hondaea fermentalgiana]|uniref:Rho guanine nucleotide exchange factor, putative n=1 Tax=Hondaea fermentalgiana TaxID=2315210 RepID=A0A2R5G6V4_9STRA|nr:Rho guanine nucleotide exchange factor, putative [Hondaea fermentalgiana]|eukprot:GBG26720.1 Rho guanine nucleotide exchange factor, putative [Hondaea fermentalgiana]
MAASRYGADLSQARGIDVREQINQGFVRSELGTVADDKASRIYEAPEISPPLLERHATTAVNNYLAAISCFLRAVPTVKDTRSKKLLREHVNRLLRRLEGMRALVKEAQRLHALNGGEPVRLAPHEKINYLPGADFDPSRYRSEFDDELAAAFDELTEEETEPPLRPEPEPIDASNMYAVGADVQVFDPDSRRWQDAVVSGHDATQKYRVRFADGVEEHNVDASRVRAPRPPSPSPPPSTSSGFDLSDLPEAEIPRFEVMSEIIESERTYVLDLDNLVQFYVKALQNPAHWGGQKQQSETWFSQKTLNEQEAKEIFCNITDIAAMNSEFLGELETAFSHIQVDQSLATVFVQYAPRFELYTEFVVGFQEAQETIEKMRKERMGFRSADEAAERASVAPLKTLMRRPVDRIKEYTELLRKLQERTDPSHPSTSDIMAALDIFQRVEAYMNRALDMRANQKHVREIEGTFQPRLGLAHPKRVWLYDGKLERMEKKGPKKWKFWLFNDIIICGRESEWLARGYYRHEGTLQLRSFGSDPNYGPLAISVRGKDGDVWVLLCPDHIAKTEWLAKFALCPGVFNQDQRRVQNGEPLTDPESGKMYYFNESLSKTQWEKPTQ